MNAKGANREPSVVWSSSPHVPSVELLRVDGCAQDWYVAHADTYTFCCVLETERCGADVTYRRWSYKTGAGDLQLFGPGDVHHARARGQLASFAVAQLPGDLVRTLWRETVKQDRPPHFTQPQDAGLHRAFLNALNALADVSRSPDEVEATLIGTLLALFGRPDLVESGHAAEPIDLLRTHRAKRFIDERLEAAPNAVLTLDDIVVGSGVRGKYALCRDFVAQYGTSPIAYAKSRKLEMGRRALRRGVYVQEVARTLGYAAPAFSKAFSEQVGVPPSTYRAAFVGGASR